MILGHLDMFQNQKIRIQMHGRKLKNNSKTDFRGVNFASLEVETSADNKKGQRIEDKSIIPTFSKTYTRLFDIFTKYYTKLLIKSVTAYNKICINNNRFSHLFCHQTLFFSYSVGIAFFESEDLKN